MTLLTWMEHHSEINQSPSPNHIIVIWDGSRPWAKGSQMLFCLPGQLFFPMWFLRFSPKIRRAGGRAGPSPRFATGYAGNSVKVHNTYFISRMTFQQGELHFWKELQNEQCEQMCPLFWFKVAPSDFWVTIPFNFNQLEHHHYRSNRKSNVSGVLEKDESLK